MTTTQVMNIAGVILTAGLIHAISRRISARILAHLRGALPTDPWILYALVYSAILLGSFHTLGVISLVTGLNLVHITTLTGLVVAVWCTVRVLFPQGPLARSTRPIGPLAGRLASACKAILPVGRMERWIVGVAVALLLLFVAEAVTRPPTGWDGLVYHLPLAAKWLQNGNLNFLAESWKFQMPSNGELILLFLMYLGENRLLSLAYLPYLLADVVLVYSFARRLQVSHDHATIAAVGFGTMPIILHNAFSAYIDLFAGVFVLCTIYLILWSFQEGDTVRKVGSLRIILAGLAFGVAIGSKLTFAPLTILMAAAAALSGLVERRKPGGTRSRTTKVVRRGLAFCAWSLVLSAYWYARNLIVTGNPVHPLEINFVAGGLQVSIAKMVAGWHRPDVIMPCGGAWDSLGTWLARPWTECHFAGWFFSVNSGLGPVFSTFVPLAVLVAAAVVLATLLFKRRLPLVAFLLLMSAALLSYWWFYLYRLLRLISADLGTMFPLVGYGISLLSGTRQRLAKGLFLCALATNALLMAASPLASLGSRIHHHTWSQYAYYRVPEILDLLPRDSVVLNASHELKNYPLFGRYLRNRVVTTQALIEPERLSRINGEFVRKWQIDYIYYATNQKLVLEDEDKYQVVHRQEMQDASGAYAEVLYRTDRSQGASMRSTDMAGPSFRRTPREGA